MFKIIGVIGLIYIILGVLIKPRDRRIRDVLYIVGGVLLAVYSFYIKDVVFIILQLVFVVVAVYDVIKLYGKTKPIKAKN